MNFLFWKEFLGNLYLVFFKFLKQDLGTLDFKIIIKTFKESLEEFKDYDSELLLKILNKTSLENKKCDDKELFVDENWKINSKNMSNIIPSDNSNLKRILLDIFPNKRIVIKDNKDGSQTIFLS